MCCGFQYLCSVFSLLISQGGIAVLTTAGCAGSLHQVVGDPEVEPKFYGATTPEEIVSLAVNQGILIGADDFRALLRSGSTQYWIACGDPSNPIKHLQKIFSV